MLFKNAFEQQPSLRFVFEKLQFHSALGRQHLLNLPFCTDADELRDEFAHLSDTIELWQDENRRPVLSHLCPETEENQQSGNRCYIGLSPLILPRRPGTHAP